MPRSLKLARGACGSAEGAARAVAGEGRARGVPVAEPCGMRRYRRSRTRSTTEPGAAPERETFAATGPGEAFTTRLRRRDRCTRPLLTCSGRDGAALLIRVGYRAWLALWVNVRGGKLRE
jgi:hypothetical protein